MSLPTGPVYANRETPLFPVGSGDVADDMVIWVDYDDPSRSCVIAASKDPSNGGIAIYDLSAQQLSWTQIGYLCNIDLRAGVTLNSQSETIISVGDRGTNQLRFYKFNTSTRTITAVGTQSLGFEPYGLAMYQSSISGYTYVFVSQNTSSNGQLDQYRLDDGGSTISAVKVRDMTTPSLSEGMCCDDENAYLLLAEEDAGLYRYNAEPNGGTDRTTIDTVAGSNLAADCEGVTLVTYADGSGYIIVSSQGDSTFAVYDREDPHTFRRSFSVTGSGVDSVTGTDGIDAIAWDLSPNYPNGLMVVHDEAGQSPTNLKYVDLEQVLGPIPSWDQTPLDNLTMTDVAVVSGSIRWRDSVTIVWS